MIPVLRFVLEINKKLTEAERAALGMDVVAQGLEPGGEARGVGLQLSRLGVARRVLLLPAVVHMDRVVSSVKKAARHHRIRLLHIQILRNAHDRVSTAVEVAAECLQ